MIICNFATDNYRNMRERMIYHLGGVKHVSYTRYEQIGSPSHSESPYEFKIHAIETASKIDPVVLWIDASMTLVGDLSKIENIILQDGFYGQEAGHYIGHWTNQFTRDYFKLTEEELNVPRGMIMVIAGLLGLDLSNPIGQEFFSQWKASALAGCFRGSWDDHRHDMTCASIVAQRMGLKYQRGGSHAAYIGPGYSVPEDGVVFLVKGG